TTLNVQDLASLSDQVLQITGLRVRETVPDWLFQQADEVVMVDLTPRALLHRLERGAIYSKERAAAERESLFQEPPLVALRELASRRTAQALEARAAAKKEQLEGGGKILVNVTADASTAMLLRRARRVADFIHAETVAIFVCPTAEITALPALEKQAVERHLAFANTLHIETKIVHSKKPADTLVDFAHKNGVTQIFIGPALEVRRKWFRGLDFTEKVLYQARDIEVTVVAERGPEGGRAALYPEDEAAGLMHSGYVRIPPDITVEGAIAEIRRQAEQVEMLYYAYVLDESRHLLGALSFREIISAARANTLRTIIRTHFVSLPA